MPNIILQDLTAIIHGTSRANGDQFDLCHVETLLQTSEPLPTTLNWYVPNGSSIPPEVEEFFHAMSISMYPMDEETILKGTNDIFDQAKNNQTKEVEIDASKILLRSIMTKGNLTLVTGTTNLYHIAYDYKLFHVKDTPNVYDFKVELPFSGLVVQNGGAVQLTVTTPLNAQIDEAFTNGQTPTGQNIEEQITLIKNINRKIVSFRYQIDPLFTIRYYY